MPFTGPTDRRRAHAGRRGIEGNTANLPLRPPPCLLARPRAGGTNPFFLRLYTPLSNLGPAQLESRASHECAEALPVRDPAGPIYKNLQTATVPLSRYSLESPEYRDTRAVLPPPAVVILWWSAATCAWSRARLADHTCVRGYEPLSQHRTSTKRQPQAPPILERGPGRSQSPARRSAACATARGEGAGARRTGRRGGPAGGAAPAARGEIRPRFAEIRPRLSGIGICRGGDAPRCSQ